MTIGNTLFVDTLITVGNAPGYRDMSIKLQLNDGTGSKRTIEVHLTAEDSLALLRSLVSAYRLAWRDKPIDWKDGERRPADVI